MSVLGLVRVRRRRVLSVGCHQTGYRRFVWCMISGAVDGDCLNELNETQHVVDIVTFEPIGYTNPKRNWIIELKHSFLLGGVVCSAENDSSG